MDLGKVVQNTCRVDLRIGFSISEMLVWQVQASLGSCNSGDLGVAKKKTEVGGDHIDVTVSLLIKKLK